MFLLKDTTHWRRWGSNPRPLNVSSQALYHWVTALPNISNKYSKRSPFLSILSSSSSLSAATGDGGFTTGATPIFLASSEAKSTGPAGFYKRIVYARFKHLFSNKTVRFVNENIWFISLYCLCLHKGSNISAHVFKGLDKQKMSA